MAQLPGYEWIINQVDGIVYLSHRYTNEEIVSFDPSDGDAAARAQHTIHLAPQLNPEQKCFAHFWSGYFYAHAGSNFDE